MQGIYVTPVRTEQTSFPSALVVSVAEVKLAARMDAESTLLDSTITSYIKAATKRIESFAGITIRETTFKGYYDSFPPVMDIRQQPNTEITKIEYYDVDNALQTLSATEYMIQKLKYSANILPSTETVNDYPTTYYKTDAVIVYITAGYETADIPDDIKEAIKCMVVSMLQNCDPNIDIPKISISLVSDYRNSMSWMEN